MSESLPVSPVPLRTVSAGPRGLWSAVGLEEVETLMLRLATGQRLDRLGRILREHVSSGGNRVRARLALGAAEALGLDRMAAVPWAAACELMHNATLVHDDLQDGDRTRRGQEAAWVRHGAAQAINAGDLALMLPYRVLEHVTTSDAVRWRLARAIARHAEDVVRGQADELDLLPTGRYDISAYTDSVMGKTAALFAMPVHGAALLAGRDPEAAEAIADAFAPIGLLYQVQDDILDLYGTKGRREPGSDVREGKVSALVVEHLALHPEDEPWLIGILRTPRHETRDRDVAEVIRRFRDEGALAAAWERLWLIEDLVVESPVLSADTRLHALAIELVAQALAPIVHTDPTRGQESLR